MKKLFIASSVALAVLLAGCNDNSNEEAKANVDKASETIKQAIDDTSSAADSAQQRIDEAAKAAGDKANEIKEQITNLSVNKSETTKEIEVAPKLVDCVGTAPMQCMSVKEAGQDSWQLYYSAIEGFKFEPGYNYTLKVQETEYSNVPADASAVRWKLIDIISKTAATE